MRASRDETQAGTIQVETGSATDVGRVRTNNEDNYRVVPELKLFVLSDGIGGQANGEVASAMAIETIVTRCLELSNDESTDNGNDLPSGISRRTNDLAEAAYLANQNIRGASVNNHQFQGMGATVVAAWVDGLRLSLAHAGDSRAYLLRGTKLESLTSDHTLVAEQVRTGLITAEQAQTNPLRRLLVRALGVRDEVEIELQERELRGGDVLLLCTDGLTGMVSESEIADLLLRERDPQKAAESLIDSANNHGGEDNVTAIVVRVGVSDGEIAA